MLKKSIYILHGQVFVMTFHGHIFLLVSGQALAWTTPAGGDADATTSTVDEDATAATTVETVTMCVRVCVCGGGVAWACVCTCVWVCTCFCVCCFVLFVSIELYKRYMESEIRKIAQWERKN